MFPKFIKFRNFLHNFLFCNHKILHLSWIKMLSPWTYLWENKNISACTKLWCNGIFNSPPQPHIHTSTQAQQWNASSIEWESTKGFTLNRFGFLERDVTLQLIHNESSLIFTKSPIVPCCTYIYSYFILLKSMSMLMLMVRRIWKFFFISTMPLWAIKSKRKHHLSLLFFIIMQSNKKASEIWSVLMNS